MRAPISALFLVGSVALAAACSSSSRDPFGPGAKGGSAKPSETAEQAPPGESGEFDQGARPDAGPADSDSEVCAPDPARYEAAENECDDDGDGEVDNVQGACDSALQVTGDAEQFARSLGICKKIPNVNDPSWGLISAKYTKGFNQSGQPAAGQHGILGAFGSVVKPREGDMFGVLSTGFARAYDSDSSSDPKAFKDGTAMQGLSFFGGSLPPGYPKSSPGCPAIPMAHDIAVVRLEIKTPKNAKGFQFDFNFYSGEWPEWVCSTYNDGFIAYLKSKAFNGGAADNVSFDSKGAPVSVNNAFFDRCTPNTEVGCLGNGALTGTTMAACPGGEAELVGTGFEKRGTYCGDKESLGGGATGWLTSQAPVEGGETITLEFYIWDSGDGRYNSSVLLDNFRWVPKPVVASTERPPK